MVNNKRPDERDYIVNPEPDVEGHLAFAVTDDEGASDTEGHRIVVADDGDEDTEGHGIAP